MTTRNLSPQRFFDQLAAAHRPRMAFVGKNARQFQAWKKQVLPRALATLGEPPKRVPPNLERLAQWREDGLIKERWVLDVQPGLSATMLIFRPQELKRGEKRPAILASHGHGHMGKNAVMGVAGSNGDRAAIRDLNYDYGLQMAKRGFVTYSLDWLGFGERDARGKPFLYKGMETRDPCNIYYLCATMLGATVMGMNCSDAGRVTDFVAEQSYADPDRLGVMGLSLGGTMTTWMALFDNRFKAINNICYAGPWYETAYRTYNVCGSQVVPGIYSLVDVADLQGMIAPRPLLMEVGVMDGCFDVDHSMDNYRAVERIYKAAGAADKLELDQFPGGHAWGGNKSEAFFRKHFGADWA